VLTQYVVASGASVSAEGSWLLAKGYGFKMAYTVMFENATADYDSTRGSDALKLYDQDQPPRSVRCEGGDGYVGELRYLIGCIEAGQPPSVVTGADGLSAVEICVAEERSAQTGQVVTLD